MMSDCPLAAVLAIAATRLGEPVLARLAAGLTVPVRVRVRGKPGVGVRTAVRALRTAGIRICGPEEEPDVEVYVITDDRTGLDGRPDLAVLNKADLLGSAAVVSARCREIRQRTGVSTVALSALAACSAFDPSVADGQLWAIAGSIGAMPGGADRIAVRSALRVASGVDAVCAAVDQVSAPARYRRIEATLTELSCRATGPEGSRLAALLAGDDVVLSRMVAAAEVLRGAGMPVPPVPADPLAAAIRWRRYAGGPVSDLHRACAADLARGALRLWDRRPAVAGPTARRAATAGLRQTRIEAATAVRATCAALRTELQTGAAEATRAEAFVRRARHRVAAVAAEADAEITWRLAAAGAGSAGRPDPPVLPEGPPLRTAALEGRLTALIGLTFGAGAALTLSRALIDLVPGWSQPVMAGCAVIGLTIGGWIIRVRRVLSERAAADRWVAEITAGLRSALDDLVTVRFAAAEVTPPTCGPFTSEIRHTPVDDGDDLRVNLPLFENVGGRYR